MESRSPSGFTQDMSVVESNGIYTANFTPTEVGESQLLNLISFSAKLLHHALVWMVGFRMAGFMLSGSGIRVFVLGNVELGWGGWGKVQVNGVGVVGMGCGGGLGWWVMLSIGGA